MREQQLWPCAAWSTGIDERQRPSAKEQRVRAQQSPTACLVARLGTSLAPAAEWAVWERAPRVRAARCERGEIARRPACNGSAECAVAPTAPAGPGANAQYCYGDTVGGTSGHGGGCTSRHRGYRCWSYCDAGIGSSWLNGNGTATNSGGTDSACCCGCAASGKATGGPGAAEDEGTTMH